ncbi:MAG TPA: universal stress protein [Candidatus Limnocylindria bacterium]|nr:universal stress protein [Candidatus Limnocylindria bacterium]
MTAGYFSHVLVPHDFTAAADEALRTALALAASEGGEVTVIHVIAPFYPLRDLAYGPHVLDPGTLEKRVLARLERHVAQRCGRQPVRCTVTTGNPGQRIVDAAAGASCVVMSTSGRTGAAHALIGSVAERVVRFSPVPVFVLPSKRRTRARRRSRGR